MNFVCKCIRCADLRTLLYSQHNFATDLDVQNKFVNIMSTQLKFIAAYLERACENTSGFFVWGVIAHNTHSTIRIFHDNLNL